MPRRQTMLDIDITHVIEYYLLQLNIITHVYNVEINVKIMFFNNRVTNVNNVESLLWRQCWVYNIYNTMQYVMYQNTGPNVQCEILMSFTWWLEWPPGVYNVNHQCGKMITKMGSRSWQPKILWGTMPHLKQCWILTMLNIAIGRNAEYYYSSHLKHFVSDNL